MKSNSRSRIEITVTTQDWETTGCYCPFEMQRERKCKCLKISRVFRIDGYSDLDYQVLHKVYDKYREKDWIRMGRYDYVKYRPCKYNPKVKIAIQFEAPKPMMDIVREEILNEINSRE